jgi:acyl carrier protein
MYNDDSKKDITKDEVISRVLDVIQSYLKVGHHKVTEETHFCDDLGLEAEDYIVLHKALYLEFKLNVPFYDVRVSCKELIDYIYDNRMERMDFEEFREFNITGHIFWPGPLLIWGPGQEVF